MSNTVADPAKFRLSRSVLYAIGDQPQTIEAASSSSADVVLFELEDAVPVTAKAQARRNVTEALGDLDWGHKTITVRVNALDSPYTFRDVISLLEAPTADRIDLLFLPKVGVAADVYAFDVLVSQVERDVSRAEPVGFDAMIESTAGMANIKEIAAASPRLEALHLGTYDYAQSAHMGVETVGGSHSDYALAQPEIGAVVGDLWHHNVARLVMASRASGLRPIDGPWVHPEDYDADPEGLRVAALRGKVLGCNGKQAMTPGQASIINDVFSPTTVEIEAARRACAAAEAAQAQGQRMVVMSGHAVDRPTVTAAQQTVAAADSLGL